MKQKTSLMLKPDVPVDGHVQEVLRELHFHGLVIEKSCTPTATMGVIKTLVDRYASVTNSISKDFNSPEKLFNSLYYDGPRAVMPMEISCEGGDDIITPTRTLAGETSPQDASADTTRGKYSDDSYEKASAAARLASNVVHASDSYESVQRELSIQKFHPKQTGGL